jgi:hypothetical protein
MAPRGSRRRPRIPLPASCGEGQGWGHLAASASSDTPTESPTPGPAVKNGEGRRRASRAADVAGGFERQEGVDAFDAAQLPQQVSPKVAADANEGAVAIANSRIAS